MMKILMIGRNAVPLYKIRESGILLECLLNLVQNGIRNSKGYLYTILMIFHGTQNPRYQKDQTK
nr:MAG TPA: hypothetical protein [Caudoviricetes sp.]